MLYDVSYQAVQCSGTLHPRTPTEACGSRVQEIQRLEFPKLQFLDLNYINAWNKFKFKCSELLAVRYVSVFKFENVYRKAPVPRKSSLLYEME